MIHAIRAQFRHPRGILGRFVGALLAIENRERSRWTVAQLDPKPADRILEIGFGPGVSIQLLAQRVSEGWVAGVDSSDVMVQEATRRNAAAIRSGRVELRQSGAGDLPYDADTLDTVLAINAINVGDVSGRGLQEARRVLKTGGSIAIVEQPPSRPNEAEMRERIQEIVTLLQEAGFHSVESTYTPLRRGITAFVRGVK